QEYREHEDLPNSTNPDEWLKIAGKKGERIVFMRILLKEAETGELKGGKAIERVGTGPYL
ncbi:MAG: proteasome-associated ATPase, partial [Actinomycetota bacterium]|nr:proteasome-associated ATPase [Actinomycetota bacterium]